MNRNNNSNRLCFYEIRVKGHLDCEWSGWFDNLTITHEAEGVSLLTGPFIDQAALYGLLKKLHEIGLPLISFKRVESDPTEPQGKGG